MISMDLRDIRSPQYEAVTGRRRKIPYQSILTALGPSIREEARQEDLDALREKELIDAENRYNAKMSFNREKMGIEQEQAAKSAMIQGATLVPTAAYVADKAGMISLKDIGSGTKSLAAAAKAKLFGSPAAPAAPVGEGAIPTAAAGTELASAGGTAVGSLAGGEAGANVTAAQAAEAMYASEAGGVGTTAAPAAGIGAYALPIVASYFGSQVGNVIAQKGGEAIGIGGEKERSFVGKVGGGAAAGALAGSFVPVVGTAVGAVIGAGVGLVDWVSSSTWLCTAIDEAVGISGEDKERLSRLRRWSLKNHNGWARRYLQDGGKIVAGMEAHFRMGIRPIYEILKVSFVAPVTKMVEKGRFEDAYNIYFSITEALAREYAPEFEIWELPRGDDEHEMIDDEATAADGDTMRHHVPIQMQAGGES